MNNDKFVLLTGANGGIGKVTLEALIKEGYQVISLDINDTNIKDLDSYFIKCDVSNREDIEILRNYVNEGDTFAEKVQRNCALITRCKIRYDSKDKEMMKIFWKNYFQHTLN